MGNMNETSNGSRGGARMEAVGQRLLPICYFSAVAIAMAGWVWAIGWVVFATANWLFA